MIRQNMTDLLSQFRKGLEEIMVGVSMVLFGGSVFVEMFWRCGGVLLDSVGSVGELRDENTT